MNSSRLGRSLALVIAAAILASLATAQDVRIQREKPTTSLPLAFVENAGQWDSDVGYLARRDGMAVQLKRDGVWLKLQQRAGASRLRGVVLALSFLNARGDVRLEGIGRLPATYNFIQANDRSRWRAGVAGFAKVAYRGVYDGVDAVFRDAEGTLEYDFILAPGADLTQVRVRVAGGLGMEVAADGALVIHTALGDLRQKAPVTWEVATDGSQRPVNCRYRLLGDDCYGFTVGRRTDSGRLVIDPGLDWCTYIGTASRDAVTAVAYHIAHHWSAVDLPVMVGHTVSTKFPTTPGAFDTTANGGMDVFVAKTDYAATTLLVSTFLGGSGKDTPVDVSVSATGVITVVGITESKDFPTTSGAYSRTYGGNGDVFVTRLDPKGASLVFSTFLGGSAADTCTGLVELANGDCYLTGSTSSTNFPTTAGAHDTTANGAADGFVTRLDAKGAKLVASTYLGSTGSDSVGAITVGATTGTVVVAGHVLGVQGKSDFPTTSGAYDRAYSGGTTDAFVTQFDGALTKLVTSTFLGGTGDDQASGVAVDRDGEMVVAGWTTSSNFPTTKGAFDTTHNGSDDGWVTRLNAGGATLVYSTYFGGAKSDRALALAVDGAGAATVAGVTDSTDLPVTKGATQMVLAGKKDLFACRFGPLATTLHYATYYGGKDDDLFGDLALDPVNNAMICGETYSTDLWSLISAYRRTNSGGGDGFVTRLAMAPQGTKKYGFTTPACLGPIVIGVNEMAISGSSSFQINCMNAPPNTVGVFLMGRSAYSSGHPFFNIKLHIDPLFPMTIDWVYSDARGRHVWPQPIPKDPIALGAHVFCQYVWAKTKTCPPLPHNNKPIAASNAIMIRIQPN